MNQNTLYIAEAIGEYLVISDRGRLLKLISGLGTVERANEELRRLTGIRYFFRDHDALDQLRQGLMAQTVSGHPRSSREWGDFQTPPRLADQVCHYLAEFGILPRIIVEPTYGAGNFVLAALEMFPTAELVYGVEIQEKYEWQLKLSLLAGALKGRRAQAEIELHRGDIFTHRFPDAILGTQDILIIGNPPWVTNAELGALDARNVPTKRNFKTLNGMDAITGKSNFDLGEYVLLRMLDLFSEQRGTLAMLCKNSVIKNVVEMLPRRQFRVSGVHALEIDAGREFGVSVEASLLVLSTGASHPMLTCQVATLDHPGHVTHSFGWTRERFVSRIEDYEVSAEVDGQSPFIWRQGLKHDCARIMELDVRGELCVNGMGQVIDVEDNWLYWLLKGSDLAAFEVDRARKKVIVTQHSLRDDTAFLQADAPKLWQYLTTNSRYFEMRKSSIYRNRPSFSVFGIGEYSFKAYKVAVSGLHKEPRFSLVPPFDGRTVMLDDTCYYLGFDTYLDALLTVSLLSSPIVQQFLQSIAFKDAKRPYTKEVLMRVDLAGVAARCSFDSLQAVWARRGYKPRVSVSASDFEKYKQRLAVVDEVSHGSQLQMDVDTSYHR